MEKKITKRVVLEAIKVAAENGADFGEVGAEEVIAYATKTIEQIDAKNEKAKERAKEKRAEADALTEAIADVVGEDAITIDEIVEKVGADFEGVTRAKVAARLGKLVKANRVAKTQVKTEDGRKIMAYAVATEEEEVAEEDAE